MRAPQFKGAVVEWVSRVLSAGETASCGAVCAGFVVVGTSVGRLILFDRAGCFLVATDPRHAGPVACLLIHHGCVVSAGEDGAVCHYDWHSGLHHTLVLAPSPQDPITAISVSADFNHSAGTGALYFARSGGILTRRSRSAIFGGYADEVLFNESKSVLRSLSNHRLSSAGPEEITTSNSQASSEDTAPFLAQQSPLQSPLVPSPQLTNLLLSGDVILFTWRDRVFVYSDKKGRIIGRLLLVDTHGRTLSQKISKSQMSIDSVDGPLARHSRTVPHIISLDDTKTTLAIQYGPFLYICALDNRGLGETAPLTVLRHFQAQKDISEITLLGKNVVLVFHGSSGSPNQVALFDIETMHLVDMFSMPAEISEPVISVMAGYITEGLVGGYVDPTATSETASGIVDDTVALASHQIGSSEVRKGSIVTRCYLLFDRTLFVFRPLYASEQVLWLLQHRAFHAAKHLCASLRRSRELVEVGNEYACQLWLKGDHWVAVQVWAEYVLPYAPQKHWTLFVQRLEKAGKLHLIEKYLPFNDRAMVDATVYAKVLEHHLTAGNFRRLLKCIKLWPVIYPVERVLVAIVNRLTTMIDESGHVKVNAATTTPKASDRVASVIVVDFSNFDTPQPSTAEAAATQRGSFEQFAPGNEALGLGPSGAASVTEEQCSQLDETVNDDDNGIDDNHLDHSVKGTVDDLLRCVLKLFEFSNQFIEAAQVLLLLHEINVDRHIDLADVVDYFHAHHLWTVFNEPTLEKSLAARRISLGDRVGVPTVIPQSVLLQSAQQRQRLFLRLIRNNADGVFQYAGQTNSVLTVAMISSFLEPLKEQADQQDADEDIARARLRWQSFL